MDVDSETLGRRPPFLMTLLLAGVFGLAVGGAKSWLAVCGLYAAVGVGIGGSLPVDGAIFLEYLPNSRRGLLTLLSIWWPIGQLLGSASTLVILHIGCY